MTSAPFDYRSELMHKSYDAKASNRSRKAAAIERLLHLMYRRAAPDYRLVHRFREWQQNDLNQMLASYLGHQQWKQRRHERGLLVLLSFAVSRAAKAAIWRWRLEAIAAKRRLLTPERVAAAGKLAAVLLGRTMGRWCRCQFPMVPHSSGKQEKAHLLALAVNKWKTASVGCLLYSSRRGMGAVRMCQLLYLKTRPLLQRLYERLAQHRGWKPALSCLLPSLQYKRCSTLQHAFARLEQSRFHPSVSLQLHTALLTLRKALQIQGKRRQMALAWKQLRLFAPSLQVSQRLTRLIAALKRNHRQIQLKSLYALRTSTVCTQQIPTFDMDLAIIRTQMQVAAMLEVQTIDRRAASVDQIRRIKLFRAFRFVKNSLRQALHGWRRSGVQGRTVENEDVLFEYVRFLEEQNGISASRLPQVLH